MSIPGIQSLKTAASEKLSGQQPGKMRALAAAASAGITTAVLTYRLLRSGQ